MATSLLFDLHLPVSRKNLAMHSKMELSLEQGEAESHVSSLTSILIYKGLLVIFLV